MHLFSFLLPFPFNKRQSDLLKVILIVFQLMNPVAIPNQFLQTEKIVLLWNFCLLFIRLERNEPCGNLRKSAVHPISK